MAAKKTTKAAEETTEVKKTTRAKKAKEPKEPVVSVVIQFQGKNTDVNNLVQAATATYKAEGNQDEVESVQLYIQPENGIAYYVVNGKTEGKSVTF